jgi:hypothetical protein
VECGATAEIMFLRFLLMETRETLHRFLHEVYSEGQETGARQRPNTPVNFFRGVVDRARKFENNLNHFIHFQLQNNAPICPQITSNVKLTLGKSFMFL